MNEGGVCMNKSNLLQTSTGRSLVLCVVVDLWPYISDEQSGSGLIPFKKQIAYDQNEAGNNLTATLVSWYSICH